MCSITWSNKTDTHSFGATLNAQLTSSVACVNYCASNSSCAGVEVDTTSTPIRCWVYVDSWRLAYSAPLPGINQYIVVAKTCTNQTAAGRL